MQCQICCDPTQGFHCNYCQFYSCRDCIERWISMNSALQPSCSNCQGPWDEIFLSKVLRKAWMLNQFRQQVKMELYQQDQPLREQMIQQHQIPHQRIHRLTQQDKDLTDQIVQMYQLLKSDKNLPGIKAKKQRLMTQRSKVRTELDQIYQQLKSTEVTIEPVEITGLFRCPWNYSEQCQGYIQPETYQCQLCHQLACEKCREAKTDDHQCRSEDLELWGMIEQDYKPCPQCRMMVTKMEGCSQMFCANCHTAFNWDTGKVDPGEIHNPDGVRYLQEHRLYNPRCFHLPLIQQLKNLLGESGWRLIEKPYQFAVSIKWLIERLEPDHLEISQKRLMHLVGLYSSEKYQKYLYRVHRHQLRKSLLHEIVQKYSLIFHEQFHRLAYNMAKCFTFPRDRQNESRKYVMRRQLYMLSSLRRLFNQSL